MRWVVTNLTHMDHPFHTHGFFFQPKEIQIVDDEVPENNQTITIDYIENKDVFRLPGRPRPQPFTSRTITRALMKLDDTGREGLVTAEGGIPAEDTSAGWLTHCHILEHSANGMLTFFETRYKDASFHLLGNGLGGTNGIPTLRGSGDLVDDGPYSIELTGALENATAGLFLGLSQLGVPFKGGLLVPSPDVLVIIPTSNDGEIDINAVWPAGVTGGELWLQYWIQDPGGVYGFAASNGIKMIGQ